VATGTIVDAGVINAPSSTKSAKKARDPEMRQTKKGNHASAFRRRQPHQTHSCGDGDAGLSPHCPVHRDSTLDL
jgi:hypothetical protein